MLSVTDEKLLPTEENPTTPPSPSFENLFPNPPQKVIVFRAHVSLSSQPDFSVQDPHFVFTFYYHHYFLNSPNLKNLAGTYKGEKKGVFEKSRISSSSSTFYLVFLPKLNDIFHKLSYKFSYYCFLYLIL